MQHSQNEKVCMNAAQQEGLEMILHKIGRILNGDPNTADRMTGLIAYAGGVSALIGVCAGAMGTLLRLLPELYTGTFGRVDQVEVVRASSVRVGGSPMLSEGDGEVLGPTPVQIDCRPGILPVLTPSLS